MLKIRLLAAVALAIYVIGCTGRAGFWWPVDNAPETAPAQIGEACGSDVPCVSGTSCSWGVCDYWVGLGGSDFGPASTTTTWGSASGLGISGTGSRSQWPMVNLDASGGTLVAWKEAMGPVSTADVYVVRLLGNSWARLGDVAATWDDFSTGAGYSLATNDTGTPFVAWHSGESGNREIYVAQFDGVAWVEVGTGSTSGGGMSNTAGASLHPKIDVDSSGLPIVAWEDDSRGNSEVYVARFDGTDWVDVGSGSRSGGGISNTSNGSYSIAMALDAAGDPVVTWFDHTPTPGTPEIYVIRFDGSNWVELGPGSASGGGISNNAGSSLYPDVAVDGAGNAIVTWRDGTSGFDQIYVLRFNGSVWEDVGSGSSSGVGISNSTRVDNPKVEIDGTGAPVVAWQDSASGLLQIYIKRFDGTSWVEVGSGSATGRGISGNSGSSRTAEIVINAAGNPYVVWADSTSGTEEIYAARFDGNAWVELHSGTGVAGGVSNGAGGFTMPSLAMDDSGLPVAAWADESSGKAEIYVARFDGNVWAEMGSGSASGGGVSNSDGGSQNVSLALGPTGSAALAWSDSSSGAREIYVARFDGSSWEEVGSGSATGGGISNSTVMSDMPCVVLDAAGNPVVAWWEWDWMSPSSSFIYVLRFDGNAWVALGGSSASGNGISSADANSPAMVLDAAGDPIVAYTDYPTILSQIHVVRFDGGSWREVGVGSATGGGVSNSPGDSQLPSLAVDASDSPIIAWADASSGEYEIYVRRFNGNVWAELGSSSASGGGVSNTAGRSRWPSLALDAAGDPVVAWQDESTSAENIYVARFDGAMWVEVSPGSASATGISNSAADSEHVSLVVAGARMCAAWREAGRDVEVVLRCHE